jgi:nucleotide-binding universal stress UspA family protein
MYKKILVPLDGSKRSEKILPYVEDIAQQHEATIILMQVLESPTFVMGPYNTTIYYDQELTDQLVKDSQTYLEALAEQVRERGVAVRVLLEYGATVRTILEVAEREGADLIAMASHGRTGMGRVFYGSVAAGVLQQADRPLLVIRAGDLE